MANPTTNFGWVMPTSTDLVTDLPADFAVFGQAVDTSMADLKGGTTGQILAKATNTDMDFTWITNDQGDITAVNTTAPLAGGGTSGALTLSIAAATTSVVGAVQLSDSTSTTSSVLAATPTAVKSAYDLADGAIAKTTVTTAGDILYRNATVPTRLGIGTAGQVLTVNAGATAPEWATAAGGASFSGCLLLRSGNQSISNSTDTAVLFDVETFDVGGYHSTSTNTSRITIPSGKGGYYQFNYNVMWASNSSGLREVMLFKNGTRVQYFTALAIASGSQSQAITMIQAGAVNDYFEVYVFQNSGGALNLQGTATAQGSSSFSCSYLGA
jgi:hypothetical protein